ncbi:hypothetical protein F183_A54810 (plasmid) [Bryobacterales bacterium F-183]|nr:hypothetical protein F183_A54810 [Bryobacterales bacterium F-183]
MRLPRAAARLVLRLSNLWVRLTTRLMAFAIGGAFARFGAKSAIVYPVRLAGVDRIAIGARVFIGSGSWLQALPDGANTEVALTIGDRVSMSGACVLSAARSVTLEAGVLLARNVYISDHIHKYSQIGVAISEQGLDKIAPVRIREGAWLGQNVVVCPGVTIGRGSVIGANSVVTTDIEDYAVAVGAPARVVKRFGPQEPLS